jgi:hypothetical protein
MISLSFRQGVIPAEPFAHYQMKEWNKIIKGECFLSREIDAKSRSTKLRKEYV